jgi:hypothetical protein
MWDSGLLIDLPNPLGHAVVCCDPATPLTSLVSCAPPPPTQRKTIAVPDDFVVPPHAVPLRTAGGGGVAIHGRPLTKGKPPLVEEEGTTIAAAFIAGKGAGATEPRNTLSQCKRRGLYRLCGLCDTLIAVQLMPPHSLYATSISQPTCLNRI